MRISVLVGIGTAPILMAPQNVPMNSGASRQSMSTRFSGSTPISRSAFPVRFTSSWTCP